MSCSHPTILLHFILYRISPSALSTLSLHDALPIWIFALETHGLVQRLIADCEQRRGELQAARSCVFAEDALRGHDRHILDRKSTRLNSSHITISYAVFCLKKKKKGNVIPECTIAMQ